MNIASKLADHGTVGGLTLPAQPSPRIFLPKALKSEPTAPTALPVSLAEVPQETPILGWWFHFLLPRESPECQTQIIYVLAKQPVSPLLLAADTVAATISNTADLTEPHGLHGHSIPQVTIFHRPDIKPLKSVDSTETAMFLPAVLLIQT